MTLTEEQLLALKDLGREMNESAMDAYLAYANPGRKNACLNRVAIAARRIAEIVLPQDLRYIP